MLIDQTKVAREITVLKQSRSVVIPAGLARRWSTRRWSSSIFCECNSKKQEKALSRIEYLGTSGVDQPKNFEISPNLAAQIHIRTPSAEKNRQRHLSAKISCGRSGKKVVIRFTGHAWPTTRYKWRVRRLSRVTPDFTRSEITAHPQRTTRSDICHARYISRRSEQRRERHALSHHSGILGTHLVIIWRVCSLESLI